MSVKVISNLDFVGWAVPTATVRFAPKSVPDKSKVVVRQIHPALEQMLGQL